jgi:hypothetical protein
MKAPVSEKKQGAEEDTVLYIQPLPGNCVNNRFTTASLIISLSIKLLFCNASIHPLSLTISQSPSCVVVTSQSIHFLTTFSIFYPSRSTFYQNNNLHLLFFTISIHIICLHLLHHVVNFSLLGQSTVKQRVGYVLNRWVQDYFDADFDTNAPLKKTFSKVRCLLFVCCLFVLWIICFAFSPLFYRIHRLFWIVLSCFIEYTVCFGSVLLFGSVLFMFFPCLISSVLCSVSHIYVGGSRH